MDVVFWLIIGIASAILGYFVVAGERRGRAWGGATAVGLLLTVFGAIAFGLNFIYGLLRLKLVDDPAGENEQLFVGIVILLVLVVLAADLLGKIDIIGQIQRGINNRPDAGRPNPGGPAGPSGDD